MQEKLDRIRIYARENKIPIMQEDGINYLCDYIKKHRIYNILEVGTAIGYSSIRMALTGERVKVTTLEKDTNRYNEAIYNIKDLKLKRKINAINIDALDYEDYNKYDLIFIDAAKSKNTVFFEKFSHNLKENGVIVTDNLSFHGLVENSSLIKTKNQEGIVRKIKDYIEFLDNNQEFITTYVNVGDKISISKRRSN